MIADKSEHTTWPQLAEELFAFLTGRGATIEYNFDKMDVYVPDSTHPEAPQAKWRLNGTLRIRTSHDKPNN